MKISNLFVFWAGYVNCHDANDRCLQPMAEVGMCRAHFRKYSFNVDEGKFQKKKLKSLAIGISLFHVTKVGYES